MTYQRKPKSEWKRPTFSAEESAERIVMRGIWNKMKRRCHNPADVAFARYGGRGISCCARWSLSFEAFVEDMGSRPSPKHSLDRINNDKGYSKENCRWATRTEQNRNRSDSVILSYDGLTMTQTEWANKLGIAVETLRERIQKGWPEDLVFAAMDFNRDKQIIIDVDGRSQSLMAWVKEFGLNYSMVYFRYKKGLPIEHLFK